MEELNSQPESPVEKKKYVVQPRDKDGNPFGQPSVYEYATEQELIELMANSVANGTTKIRELTKAQRIIPEDAEKAPEIIAAKPHDLNADELFSITNELRDPTTVVGALDRYYEARFGRKPEETAKVQELTLEQQRQIQTGLICDRWMARTHDYYDCQENADAMMGYLKDRKLPVTEKNLQVAFRELRQELAQAPEDDQKKAPVAESTPAHRNEEPPANANRQPRSTEFTAVTREDAKASSARPRKEPTTARDEAMMDPDEYKAYVEAHPEKFRRR
jgi:hypothetical protein